MKEEKLSKWQGCYHGQYGTDSLLHVELTSDTFQKYKYTETKMFSIKSKYKDQFVWITHVEDIIKQIRVCFLKLLKLFDEMATHIIIVLKYRF